MEPTQTTNIEKLLQMQFEDAPAEMQSLLTSNAFQNTVFGIGDLYELEENAKNELLNEVTLICLGLSSVEELAARILPIVGNDQEKADEIATQTFETILYENLGIIPTSLTPRAEEVLAAMESEENADVAVATPTTADILAQTPVSEPTPTADQQPATESEHETSSVPRYAKPLTDLPRYDQNE